MGPHLASLFSLGHAFVISTKNHLISSRPRRCESFGHIATSPCARHLLNMCATVISSRVSRIPEAQQSCSNRLLQYLMPSSTLCLGDTATNSNVENSSSSLCKSPAEDKCTEESTAGVKTDQASTGPHLSPIITEIFRGDKQSPQNRISTVTTAIAVDTTASAFETPPSALDTTATQALPSAGKSNTTESADRTKSHTPGSHPDEEAKGVLTVAGREHAWSLPPVCRVSVPRNSALIGAWVNSGFIE